MALAYEDLVKVNKTEFLNKVVAISKNLGIDPNWLMIVMRFETANTMSPSVTNKGSGAVGLIQFTKTTAANLGTSVTALAAMSNVEQLDYVEKYLKPYKGKMTDLYNLYLAVFSPAYIGRPDAQKVYAKPSNSYTLNAALDTDKDGVITVGEIKSVISRYIPAGFTAGSLTVEQVKTPIALIIVGVLILLFLLNNNQ